MYDSCTTHVVDPRPTAVASVTYNIIIIIIIIKNSNVHPLTVAAIIAPGPSGV